MTGGAGPAIEFDRVTVSRGGREVLADVSLRVGKGDFFGVIGPNGGGKTTLLQVMLGLVLPDRGAVRVMGRPPAESRTRVGYVPQAARFRRDFPVTVREVVLMGRLGQPLTWGPYRHDDREAARRALHDAAVDHLASRAIGTLSGGELQRVLIARALVNEPALLLLDEPTANVDATAEKDLLTLLHALNEWCTIVLVTHDIGLVAGAASRVALVNRRVECHDAAAMDGDAAATLLSRVTRADRHPSAG